MALSGDLPQWKGNISLARDSSHHSGGDTTSGSMESAPFEPAPARRSSGHAFPAKDRPAFAGSGGQHDRSLSGEPHLRQPPTPFERFSGIHQFSRSSKSREESGRGNSVHDQSKYFQAPAAAPGTPSYLRSDHRYAPAEATPASIRQTSASFRLPLNRSSALRTPRNLSTTNASNTRSRAHEADSTFVSSCVVAILEGRGGARGEVGLASIHLNNPCLILCQFADTRTYSRTLAKLSQLNPAEVLIPMTAGAMDPTAYSKLYEDIGEYCPHATLTYLQRKYFNEERGNQCVKHLCAPEYMSVELQLHHKSYRFEQLINYRRMAGPLNRIFYRLVWRRPLPS